MTNKEMYMKEVNTCEEYKTTCKEFEKWLSDNEHTETFNRDLRQIEDVDGLYNIAIDYSIPLIMVKKYLNNLN